MDSSLDNISFHSKDDETESQQMFKDFAVAMNETLSVSSINHSLRFSSRAKSDSFLTQNDSVSNLLMNPLSVPVKQKSLPRPTTSYATAVEPSSIANCCTIMLNDVQKSTIPPPG